MSHTTSAADSFESNIKKECEPLKNQIDQLSLVQKKRLKNILLIINKKNISIEIPNINVDNPVNYYLIISICCNYIICIINESCESCFTTNFLEHILFFSLWKNNFDLFKFFFNLITALITDLNTTSKSNNQLANNIHGTIIAKINMIIADNATQAAKNAETRATARTARATARDVRTATRAEAKTARAEKKATERATKRTARAEESASSEDMPTAPATMSKKSKKSFFSRLFSGIFKPRSRSLSVQVHVGGTKRKKQRVKCKTCKNYKKQVTY